MMTVIRGLMASFLLLYAAGALTVDVLSVNSDSAGLYEKFEIIVQLDPHNYSNPYDPDQIDLRAVFIAPSGRIWDTYGFYDNYSNRNRWTVRFSANETGIWGYYLTARDGTGEAQSQAYSFQVITSDYHGWLRVSEQNPHYFEYDDGTPFYGVGAYYPWGVSNTSTGLGKLEASGANMFGYWNIMYGGEGNIIESMSSGIGRYDQPKCGRIDQIITWAEQRNMKVMLAIWPHDLLSNTVWAHQWHQNPYKDVCPVEDFYESEAAWIFQEKQYRYLIARWGYSRSLGIWEIVNEVNGTDGWVAGKTEEARLWVKRVHDFFKTNDPFQHPTTASKSGGHYWAEGYAEIDIPNVHIYETGWPAKYPGNPLRSSAWTYYQLSRDLWNDFEKPAIFGEAGYRNSYGNFAAGSEGYLAMYHNALWASWAGGNSMTPVWWEFGSKDIMNDAVMNQMLSFSKIAPQINYNQDYYNAYTTSFDDADWFIMQGQYQQFGWAREILGNNIASKKAVLSSEIDTSYQITWYNTWTGQEISKAFVPSLDKQVLVRIPDNGSIMPDVSFIMTTTEEGSIPAKLGLSASETSLLVNSPDSLQVQCLIFDSDGRFCRSSENPIEFQILGPGTLIGEQSINAENGRARIIFKADSLTGEVTILAKSPGLQSDTLHLRIIDFAFVDHFDSYNSTETLKNVWFIKSGTSIDMQLDKMIYGAGSQSLRLNYAIGNGNAPYAGVLKQLNKDYSGALKLTFWLKGDASNRNLAILIHEKNGRYWQYDHIMDSDLGEFIDIPLSHFRANDQALTMDLEQLNEISFNILKGTAEFGEGNINLDEIQFKYTLKATSIDQMDLRNSTETFFLSQNYPNPFNPITAISYRLPARLSDLSGFALQTGGSAFSNVDLSIYNLLGQKVATLVSERQPAGKYEVEWDATGMASGVYLYKLTTDQGFTQTKKLVLLK